VRPHIDLSGTTMRANVRAYAALGLPVAAVVKNDGYGWGAARVVREIDDVVESYVVADEAEFWALRMRTRRPIRLLDAATPARLAAICAHGGIPNVTTRDAVNAAAAYARTADVGVTVRIGIVDAAGWSGIAAADVAAFAGLCARPELRVELWTHVTSALRGDATRTALDAALATFRHAGVDVVGTDSASTAWAASGQRGDRVRIGAGLFGAKLGAKVATTCAIRVDAPVTRWFAPGAIRWAGYGEVNVPANRGVAVLRCGYGDGFPKELAGDDDILSVGMQYTARLAENATREYALIDENSDLDELARRVGLGPHEFIVGIAQQK
jgi:alanine racemase